MKTNILRFSAVLLASATLLSCGGGKTAEEIQAEAQTKFEAANVELQEEAATNCESKMAEYTTAALDSLKMAN